jgi:hypothetical protein
VENEVELTDVVSAEEPAIQIEFFDFQTQVAWPCGPVG